MGIYLQAHLNGVRPDIILLNPAVGIAVFEIKDWDLARSPREIRWDRGRPELWGTDRDGRPYHEKNPVAQVRRYQRDIYQLYCPRLQQRTGLAAITAGVILPFSDSAAAFALLKPFLGSRSAFLPVGGRGELASDDLGKVLPAARSSTSKLMSADLADDLRGWLVEPDFAREQRVPLPLDANQRRLVNIPGRTGLRRLKGPAGSGKSLVLAARAARIADKDRTVLIVSFNITLWHYLRDLVVRDLTRPGAGRNIVYRHFHGWCREVCEQAGLEHEYNALFTALPKTLYTDLEELRRARERRAAMLEQINEESLPALVTSALAAKGAPRYDAILVDEGQDFRPSWWSTLRRALLPGGEMLLVADATQDVYGTARAWTDQAMTGAGFFGPWAQLGISYRLPSRALAAVRDFAERFLPADAIDLPTADQKPLDLEPCQLKWHQSAAPGEAVALCVRELLELMRLTGQTGLANADVTFLSESASLGRKVVEALDAQGIRCVGTFAEEVTERRREKHRFYMGSERIKATTLHSFKGWEARLLVVHIDQAVAPEALALIYTALTRIKRSGEGSWLTVVCSAPELADYGES